MQPMVLTIVFAENMLSVLMCEHKKLGANNFIGGKINEGETAMTASYRELYEETGITPEDVELREVRHEITTSPVLGEWDLFVTCGVLKHSVTLREEKNKLFWADVFDHDIFLEAYGNGNCANYLREAYIVLNDKKAAIVKRRNETLYQMLRDSHLTRFYLSRCTDLNDLCPCGYLYIIGYVESTVDVFIYDNYTTDAASESMRCLSLCKCWPNDELCVGIKRDCIEIIL